MSDALSANGKMEITLTVNGKPVTLRVDGMSRLLDVLRHDLRLTGTKEGCGEGECGSCSVLMNGMLVDSCLVPAGQTSGMTITTIEGLAADDCSLALRESFLACGGAQCGICTPGMIVAAYYLLSKNPQPTIEEIQEGLSGNLCRCTGYTQIVEAVVQAAGGSGQQ